MINILPAPDHVVAVRIGGVLTGADYDRIVAETETKLRRHEHLGVYVEMTDFDDLTPEAAAKDLAYGQSKLSEPGRFPRKALVTDKQWIKVLIQKLDPLVPDSTAKVFEPAERDKALAWASAVPDS
jgi:hypothetical protein